MPPKQPFIQVTNCTKSFGNLVAVNNISMNIYKGQCIGLLGPNGAGKTTLVELIENIHKPDAGEITINQKKWENNEQELKSMIGVSLQENNFFDKLTVYETILMYATYYKKRDINKVNELIEKMHLEEKRNTYFPDLSGGQKQKLALAISLINNPKFIILDEPTTGLDPNSRKDIWDILNQLKKDGVTIILTTHYMEEAESLCDFIYIMHNGQILTDGTLLELLNKHAPYEKIYFYSSIKINSKKLKNIKEIIRFSVKKIHTKSYYYSIYVEEIENGLIKILDLIKEESIIIDNLECKKSNLNDLFLMLAGRSLL